MKIDIMTLFPSMFEGVVNESIIKRAIQNKNVEINFYDFREYSLNKHHKVDDYPYGGGAGMVLSVEPIYRCLTDIEGYKDAYKILMTPQGKQYMQETANDLALKDHIIIICGHYEGFDERVRDLVDIEISIGDYVLTGGEIGAMVLLDSTTRLLDNVLSNKESYKEDSFYNGILEYPQYTRPNEFLDSKVPDVLLSGNHANIEAWRKEQSLKRTKDRRPDLLVGRKEE